jgi:cbb3-type cytochrome oxidase cytochrome c subunit
MNYGPLIFLAAFFALASSWFGVVLTPQLNVGQLQQTNTLNGALYPVARPGVAQQGLQVYRAQGCVQCHSQQIGQSATVFDVLIADAGTNRTALNEAVRKVKPVLAAVEADQLLNKIPMEVARFAKREDAEAAVKILSVGGAKAQFLIVPVGHDISRGWGKRRNVAEDYLFDSPTLLGSVRIGPDLANIGVRQPDINWHLRHLYAPKAEVKGSTMPSYPYLFEKRKTGRYPSPEALGFAGESAVEKGYEIVPTSDAKALAAYLVSLRSDAPLFISPISVASVAPAGAATNAPVASGSAATNAPVSK